VIDEKLRERERGGDAGSRRRREEENLFVMKIETT
jgi:hypothetical protein